MSTEENKALMRRAYEAFNNAIRTGDFSPLGEVIAADIVDHNPGPGQAPGLEGVVQAFTMLRAAFSDFQITPEDVIAEGDKVVARVTIRAKHTGTFMGIPPTGKEVAQTGIDIVRIAGGKAVERWGEFDNVGLMQQLGAMPGPG